MSIFDIAHEFFYQVDEVFNKSYINVSYNGDRFFSYSTIIGKKVTGKDGKPYLLLSNENFSTTTARHISYLRRACPLPIVYVPIIGGQSDIEPSEAVNAITRHLDFYKGQKLSQKNNRQAFIENFNMLNEISENIETVKKSILNKYKPLYDVLTSEEKLKEYKKKASEKEKARAEKLKKQAEKLKKRVNRYLKKYGFATLAKLIYTNDPTLDTAEKQKIKGFLNPYQDLAFAWVDGDTVKTSKSVSVDKAEALAMLKLWAAGKLYHGMTLDRYTVLSVSPRFVTIGCHKMPVENLQSLLESMK